MSAKQGMVLVVFFALILSLGSVVYTSQVVSEMKTFRIQYKELLGNHSQLQEMYKNQVGESQRRYTGNPFTTELWPGQLQSENITGMHWYSYYEGALVNCTDNILGLNGVVQVYDYVGTDVVHTHDAEVSEPDGAYLKKKEIEVGWLFGHDKVKVAFDLKSGYAGVPVYARLYVNDVVKGVLQVENGTSYVTKTETLSGILDLDNIGLYLSGMPAENLAVVNDGPNTITVCGGIVDGILDSYGILDGYTLSSPSGLTWDGVNLWSVDTDWDRIFVHDGVTSSLLRSYPFPGSYIRGLAYDGTRIIYADDSDNKMHVINKDTGVELDNFAAPDIAPTGLTFAAPNLISCDDNTHKIYVHDGVSAAILTNFATPGTKPLGLAFDGVNLISCDVDANKIYVHDGVSVAILKTIPWSLGGSRGGITTCYYDSAAIGYAKNFRIIGEVVPMTEKAATFKNVP